MQIKFLSMISISIKQAIKHFLSKLIKVIEISCLFKRLKESR